MSPHNLRIPTHESDHKCVGKRAICVFMEALTAIGPVVEFHQEENQPGMFELNCINKLKQSSKEGVRDSSLCSELPAIGSIRRSSSEDSLALAFSLHTKALLESTPPSPLREKLTHFMEHDWHDIEKLLEGGKIDSVEDIKTHWRQIELLVGDTNDIFLQEGAVLLSLVLGETDLASEFYAKVEGMEMCISKGMRDKSLPDEIKSLLPKFRNKLLQCRDEVRKALESGMQGDKRTDALVTQREKLFAQFEAFLNQTPQSRYRDFFKRQGYECLMSLQNCQRSPLRAPELAAFSRSLRAVAANTSDSNLFGKLFHVIYTTLRDANESPTSEIASLLADQCNEILSQHGHLLSPLVVKILKAQGEAAYKCVTESVAERSVSISDGRLSQLVDSVSNLVHKWWGADVDEKGLPAKQGPVNAFEIIASVNPALAGTINHFLKSVQTVLVDVPLGPQQLAALQRLLQTELHIVDHLKKTCEGATKSEMETFIKQEFISHVDSLWPFITYHSNADISKALNKKYTETFRTLTQTSVLSSLIQRVTKLTCDRRVQALTSFALMLNSLVSGVGGSTCWSPDEDPDCEMRVDQTLWETAICPVLFPNGSNSINFWSYQYRPSTPIELYTCTSIGSLTDQILRIWTDINKYPSLCKSNRNRTTAFVAYDPEFLTDKSLSSKIIRGEPTKISTTLPTSSDLNFSCVKSFLKRLINFHDKTITHYCRRGMAEGSAREWTVPISNHSSGVFTYCADAGTQNPPVYDTLDEAQAAQLQCRRYVDPPLGSPEGELKRGTIPLSLVMRDATVKYIKDEGGALVIDTGLRKSMLSCPENLLPFNEAPVVRDMPTDFKQSETIPSYILGRPLPHLASGEQSTINVDGVVYGLYRETPSGLKPIMNKAFDATTVTTTLPSTQSHEQSTTQPSTLNFSFPVYPSLVVSNSTAVGPITTEGAVLSQHLWEALPWIGGVAAAAAVALCVYQQCRRPHIPTHTLIQQHTSGGGGDVPEYISQPLAGMRVNETVLSGQEMTPLTTDATPRGTDARHVEEV